MTTELEKQFFDTFGIKPYFYEYIIKTNRKEQMLTKEQFINFVKSEQDYLFVIPYKVEVQITDRILLELICILSKMGTGLHTIYTIKAKNTLELKQDVLENCLEVLEWDEFKKYKKGFKQQVQTLFKEE